jgi:hypothetical protein
MNSHSTLARNRFQSQFVMIGIAFMGLLFNQKIHAQLPGDLPWPGSVVNGRTVIVQPGIAAVSCGTTTSVTANERFTFGLMNVDGVVPGSGRVDVTASVQMYHHPSWLVTEIGNVFGVAINERTGDIFLNASSNYGAGFFGRTSVLGYGSIGGGAEDLSAAGTVYQIDAVTGQASVFAVLPQQSATFTHSDCEGSDSRTRTTGVGLGNIHYDQFHNQYFVTNIEDGRIYRLGPVGDIRDSYDPGAYDDGAAGITSLTDLVYGVAVEPGGHRLFFGGVSITGQVPLRSIDLSESGGFVGIINNTTLPAGATWNNYVGVETLHTNVTAQTGSSPASEVYHQLSDLEFTPDSRLLVGIRVGCRNSWFTSYNHQGESNVISRDGAGLYNSAITEFDVSVTGSFASEDAYGGVAYYEHVDGFVDFVVSSADILAEIGPHGIAVFHSADAALSPITPLAAISYGVVDNGDPKGVGGSVDVFSRALSSVIAIPTLDVWGLILLMIGLGAAALWTMLRKTQCPLSATPSSLSGSSTRGMDRSTMGSGALRNRCHPKEQNSPKNRRGRKPAPQDPSSAPR